MNYFAIVVLSNLFVFADDDVMTSVHHGPHGDIHHLFAALCICYYQ